MLSVFRGSIGKKVLMSVSGLLLAGFLVSHLAGNLLLLSGEDVFNRYAAALAGSPLLPLAELVLAAIFLTHIVSGLMVSLENRRARPVGYEASRWAGGRTVGSATMAVTGILLLGFLAVHLKTFRFIGRPASLYQHVVTAFQNPVYLGFYVVCMAGLVVHLSHGVWSAFQTLGLNQPKFDPWLRRLGYVFAASMLMFVALTIWAHFRGAAT